MMGYIRHHAIVATGYRQEEVQAVREQCAAIANRKVGPWEGDIFTVTEVCPPAVNGYCSFAIFPDGSKEWWNTSDAGDRARAEIIELLRHTNLAWAEIQYGDEERETKICHHSDDIFADESQQSKGEQG